MGSNRGAGGDGDTDLEIPTCLMPTKLQVRAAGKWLFSCRKRLRKGRRLSSWDSTKSLGSNSGTRVENILAFLWKRCWGAEDGVRRSEHAGLQAIIHRTRRVSAQPCAALRPLAELSCLWHGSFLWQLFVWHRFLPTCTCDISSFWKIINCLKRGDEWIFKTRKITPANQ